MGYRDDDFYDNEDQRRSPYAPPPAPGAPAGPPPAPAAAPSAAPAPAPAPAGVYDRNTFRDKFLSSNIQTPQDAANFVQQHQGDYGAGVKIGGAKGDMLTLPDGTIIDGIRAAGLGGQGATWTGIPSQMGGGTNGASGFAGAAGAGASGSGGAAGALGAAGGQGVDPALREALLGLMGRSKAGPIDPTTDPNLGPQSRAYAAARERSAAKERASTAERAAFEGLNSGGQGSGAFDSSLQGIQENAGRDIAGNDASLVGQEVQARRQELMQSLQLANAIGARDQSTSLQQQLAQLENTYRYAQLGQQGRQFDAQLGQQQGQFNDNYGLNKAQIEAEINRNAILAALRD